MSKNYVFKKILNYPNQFDNKFLKILENSCAFFIK
jgi:hypothetical protein